MKLVTFSPKIVQSHTRSGLLTDSGVIDVCLGYAGILSMTEVVSDPYAAAQVLAPSDLLSFLEAGETALTAAKQVLDHVRSGNLLKGPKEERVLFNFEEVKLHAPLTHPKSIRDFMSFRTHMENAYRKLGQGVPEMWFNMPTYYRANPSNVIGPEEDVIWPSFTEKLDYEFEVAMYVGKTGKDIDARNAEEYVAGFSIFNDISARDRQAHQMEIGLGPAKGKDFDTSKILGPCLVTRDEVNFDNMKCSIRINGETIIEASTKDMYWSWEEMIEFVSQDETIRPGELFGSGTIGNGSALESDKWLKPGDVIEFEADGLGVLRNRISGRKSRIKLWRGRY